MRQRVQRVAWVCGRAVVGEDGRTERWKRAVVG